MKTLEESIICETIVRASRYHTNDSFIARKFINEVALPVLKAKPKGLHYIGISEKWDGDFAFKVEFSNEYCSTYYYFNLDGTVDWDCPEGWNGRVKVDGETWEQRLDLILNETNQRTV